ncbi:MAG: hypothetical protein UZ17_ACD001000343 [Acidobacteria bacterium OLB17]|nr:MAG: hypothetical protein UZ17_ACD001000343 [Acidobacteria bacterium OLB17]MCZ2389553.1 hypothetical protein [Acidobacteriota bacterium]
MKICPKCQKTYSDDNLNFCLEDGTVLQQMASAAPPPTVAINAPVTQQQPPQQFQQADSPQGGWQQAQQPYSMQPPKKSSKAWIWVLLILGVIVLGCGAGIGGLFYLGYQEQQKELANANSYPTSTTPTPRKSTTTTTTTSPSGRKNVENLDLSLWVRPLSVYGTTKYEGGELIVSSIGANSYYVITGAEDLKSTNADVAITVRNVDSKSARIGYGLIFHSDPDKPLQQDYAFLIDSVKQRYRVAHHVPGDEKDVVKWTKNTAINSGSAANTLEMRDHPDTGKIDLYINGQLVDSIKNEFGYPGGVVGIYAGDAIPVAFKDFEIRTD